MKAEYDFSWNLRRELAGYLIEKGIPAGSADDVAIIILNKVNKDVDDILRQAGSMLDCDNGYIRW